MFIITKTTYLAIQSHALNVYSPDSFYDFEAFFSSIHILKSVKNKLFYPLFMLRRLIHAAILVSIDDGQISSSITACSTIAFFIYVLNSRPFNSRAENWVLILEEVMNSLNSVIVCLLNLDWGYIELDILSKLAMTSVLGFLIFFICLSLAILVFKVFNWYKKRNEARDENKKVTRTSTSIPYSSSHPNPSMEDFSFKYPGGDNPEDHSNMQTTRTVYEEIYSR